MRSQLIQVLKQTVKTSQKFNDYNFRSYFVRKYSAELAAVESNEGMTVSQELLEQAQRDLALIERQTVVQGLYNIEPTVVEVQK
ncbi:Oidioi.mRNA.OKI2018_I69.PAR.g10892.t1.cds [Oikopleura dioica]|uniref:Oidioi.mRNA.OKI2018_I69.PAR.g10892.t1.cds n=1 Tax=Oikopleura dioica TaxID=34765 RepID=A0ABN7RSW6_OIKDI|nr:Oidioi.mRNA.OKI2018_I69.PAR.g10892.t1.cds [Oikopleura dioica]